MLIYKYCATGKEMALKLHESVDNFVEISLPTRKKYKYPGQVQSHRNFRRTRKNADKEKIRKGLYSKKRTKTLEFLAPKVKRHFIFISFDLFQQGKVCS